MFWHKRKDSQEQVWELIQFVIFKPWKALWNWLFLTFLLLRHVDIQKSSREYNAKFNFLGITWERKSPSESSFFGFFQSLKSKISPKVASWCHLRDELAPQERRHFSQSIQVFSNINWEDISKTAQKGRQIEV